MADNRIEDAKEKIAETKQAVEQSAQIAKNIASGNYLAAAKNALKMLKNEKFKKALKKKLIGFALKALIPVIICAVFFASINKIKNEMINLMSSISTSVTGFIKRAWKWMSDDYWIKLDEKSQYVLNLETGEVLDVLEKGETPGVYTDDSGNEIPTIVKEETIVDEYIRQLGNQGLSLRQLRILGDSASSDEEVLLNGGPEKLLAEKYISEFIRADIITQEIHKKHRGGDVVVNPNNQYEIDGGVYLVRVKDEEPELNIDALDISSSGEKEEIQDIDENQKYVEMEYMSPDKFLKELGIDGDSFDGYKGQTFTYNLKEGKKIAKNLRYNYSIDMDTGNLIIIQYNSNVTMEINETAEYELSEGLTNEEKESGKTSDEAYRNQWMNNYDWKNKIEQDWKVVDDIGTGTYEIQLMCIDYKELISKYSMPYEFLINLCQVTENPEFVYHVALLARDTKIVIGVYDEISKNINANENLIDTSYYTNVTPERPESPTSREMRKEVKLTTSTTVTPTLRIEYADTWSHYDSYKYKRKISETAEVEGPIESSNIGNSLNHLHPAYLEGYTQISEYYYDTFERRRLQYIKDITQVMEYPEELKETLVEVEKSKQFLGLLANKTGKCPYDCDKELQIVEENGKLTVKNDPEAIKCAKDAEYDKNGIKVSYRIPNTTMMQMPYNNLISGLDMLYALLQSNSNGYVGEDDGTKTDEELNKTSSYDANKDFESKYVGKMQGLVEHLKYLMTFPENEEYEKKYLNIENGAIEKDDPEINYYIPTDSFYGDWWWPTDPSCTRITSGFGPRNAPTAGASTYHQGIDISVPIGTPVYASKAGTVIKATNGTKEGNYIMIDHGDGFQTIYCHLSSIAVSSGQVVSQGEVIGYSGNTGVSSGPHLHFGIKYNGVYVNPQLYVSAYNTRPTGNSATGITNGVVGQSTVVTPTSGHKTATIDVNSDDFKKICAIVAAEGSADYNASLAVISTAMNRTESSAWKSRGSTPLQQLTAKGQYVAYGNSNYTKYYTGQVAIPEHTKKAVEDALNNGIRSIACCSFRTDSAVARQNHPIGIDIGGNWFF